MRYILEYYTLNNKNTNKNKRIFNLLIQAFFARPTWVKKGLIMNVLNQKMKSHSTKDECFFNGPKINRNEYIERAEVLFRGAFLSSKELGLFCLIRSPCGWAKPPPFMSWKLLKKNAKKLA